MTHFGSLWTDSLFWEKNSEEREGKRGERACRQTFEAAIPPSCNYLAEHLSVRSLSVNQFRAWVTPGKIKGKTSVFCFVSKQSEMDREPNCRFWKKSLISGKRINTVPVVGVSRNKTLLVDSGQDSVELAQAFDSSRFPLEQGESFSDLSCLTCARRVVRLASSVSSLTSPCNGQTWKVKGTDTIYHDFPRTWTSKDKYKEISSALIANRNYTFGCLSRIYSNKRGR